MSNRIKNVWVWDRVLTAEDIKKLDEGDEAVRKDATRILMPWEEDDE